MDLNRWLGLKAPPGVEAASETDPDDPEFVAEYTDERRRLASRITRAIMPKPEAERQPRS